jgi:DNA-binding response OmpR family regulator
MKTVLIAEHDPDIRTLVALRLERAGYRTVVAGDGEAALELALAETPDLAVVDWAIPRLDGAALTRALRTADVPVLMLTADADSFAEAGANAYVQKPFADGTLREWVSARLEGAE